MTIRAYPQEALQEQVPSWIPWGTNTILWEWRHWKTSCNSITFQLPANVTGERRYDIYGNPQFADDRMVRDLDYEPRRGYNQFDEVDYLKAAGWCMICFSQQMQYEGDRMSPASSVASSTDGLGGKKKRSNSSSGLRTLGRFFNKKKNSSSDLFK